MHQNVNCCSMSLGLQTPLPQLEAPPTTHNIRITSTNQHHQAVNMGTAHDGQEWVGAEKCARNGPK